MIDCNSLGVTSTKLPQGCGEMSSPADGINSIDDNSRTNFSELVGKRAENNAPAQDEDQEIMLDCVTEDEDSLDSKWMASLLCLTQMVQKSEISAAENFLHPEADETRGENSINLGKFPADLAGKTTPALDIRGQKTSSKESSNQAVGQDLKKTDDTLLSKQNNAASKSALNLGKVIAQNQMTTANEGLSSAYSASGASSEMGMSQNGGNRQDFLHINLNPSKQAETIVSGNNKVIANSVSAGADAISMLDNIEVIRTRKQGSVTLLQLQLKPDNLGTVEAKLRLEKDHLRIELTTSTPQAAKILEKDQTLLMQVLEKAGFNHETRLSLSILERGGLSVQSVSGSIMQGGTSSDHMHHQPSSERGEGTGANSASFSEGEDKKRSATQEDNRDENPIEYLPQSSSDREENAFLSPHRLIV